MSKGLLSFITDEALYLSVEEVLKTAQKATKDAEEKLYDNVIDPFSALFDALRKNITFGQWIEEEKIRQSQKTLQNAVGNFHQDILGSIQGWKNLKQGNVIDLENNEKLIIAEVKNKYNTTKGNHKPNIYDDFNTQLNSSYKGFTAFYVEVIPKSITRYNKLFTPSDNKTHLRRPENKHIRVIDGYSFYDRTSSATFIANSL